MLAMQRSGGGFLLCSYRLFLGQAGPGRLKMHCVWKGTAPNQETSFLTQGEQWVRAKGQASTHADLEGSCGHRPLPLRSVLLGGGLALPESLPQRGSWGGRSIQASVRRPLSRSWGPAILRSEDAGSPWPSAVWVRLKGGHSGGAALACGSGLTDQSVGPLSALVTGC